MSETHNASVLLYPMLKLYREARNAINYCRDTLTLKIVIDFLKEKEIKDEKKNKVSGEVHMMRKRMKFKQMSFCRA